MWDKWERPSPPPRRPSGSSSGGEEKPRVGKRVAAVIGVLASIAGIIGFFINLSSRPKPFTLNDWASKASATCDRDFGNLAGSVTNANDAFQQAMTSWQSGQPNQQQFNYAGNLYFNAGGYYKSLAGELEQIQTPKDRKSDVDNIINAIDGLGKQDYQVGLDLRQVDFTTGTAAASINQAQQDANTAANSEDSANQLLQSAGAKRCAV